MIFCGIISKYIQVAACPVKSCMWKHRKTAECCYKNRTFSKEEYAELVGLDEIPSDTELAKRQVRLQSLIKEDLYEDSASNDR